jgi:hypothetical protein
MFLTHLRRTCLKLSIAFFSIATICCSSASAELLDGLVAYYDFQSDLTNKAPDTLGFYNATPIGSVTAGWTGVGSPTRSTMLAGNALNIVDGESATNFIRVNMGVGSSVGPGGGNLAGNFSISTWQYLSPVAVDSGERFYVYEPSETYDISWGTSGANYLAYNSQAAGPSIPIVSLANNTWHHVIHTFTISGSNVLLDVYVNGNKIGTTLSSPLTDMNFPMINFGNARNGENRVWDGMLDEIAIWDRPLSAAEVTTVYQTGLAGQSLLSPVTVPEPSTLALGVSLLAGLGLLQTRRSRAQ